MLSNLKNRMTSKYKKYDFIKLIIILFDCSNFLSQEKNHTNKLTLQTF
jgi:glutathione peroxidase-family protein